MIIMMTVWFALLPRYCKSIIGDGILEVTELTNAHQERSVSAQDKNSW